MRGVIVLAALGLACAGAPLRDDALGADEEIYLQVVLNVAPPVATVTCSQPLWARTWRSDRSPG